MRKPVVTTAPSLILLIILSYQSTTTQSIRFLSFFNTRTTRRINSSSSSSSSSSQSSIHSKLYFNQKNKSLNSSNNKIIMNKTQKDLNDAAAYNHYISKAVDIHDIHVYNTNLENQHLLSLTRSCRDIDSNIRKKFLYQYHIMINNNENDHDSSNHTTAIVADDVSSTVKSIKIVSSSIPMEIPNKVKARIPSPSGNKIAIFIEESTTSDNNDKRQIVEIWTHNGMTLSKRILLPTKEQHGNVCFDFSWFGSISWNQDESAIVYSAEMKSPVTKSYFDVDECTITTTNNNNDNDSNSGSKDAFVGYTNTLGYGKSEDWGEKYTTTSRLNLFILNVNTGKVGAVLNVPGGVSTTSTEGGYTFGQAIFSPCGKYIVYTGWDAGGGGCMPRRLGSIYCYQRPSKIYMSSIRQLLLNLSTNHENHRHEEGHNEAMDDAYVCITPNDSLARSPRICNPENGQGRMKLVYLCNADGFDTHGGVMALHAVSWSTDFGIELESKRVLVDIVGLPPFDDPDDENKVHGMSFPGLFLNQLPKNPFTPDGEHIIATTQWGSITKVIKISMDGGEVIPINFNLSKEDNTLVNDASQSLLAITSNGDVVVSQSDPSRPQSIGIIPSIYLVDNACKVKPSLILPELGSVTASSKFDCCELMSNSRSRSHVVSIHPSHGDVKSIVQGIFTVPIDENNIEYKNIPLIVVPHGGPHSCFSTSYIPSYAYLCEHGRYAVLQVNYRGSAGFGQTPLESLAGNVGRQDIDDVVQLTNWILETFTGIDSNRVGICGGSHGGFLAGHAIGQYPKLFKAAALRNPVTNIATMVTATDIPDWCYVEALGAAYNWTTFKGPTQTDLKLMWEASRKYVNMIS